MRTPFVFTGLPGELALEPPTLRRVAAGAATTFAVTADGALFAWGRNSEGQLGLGPGEAADEVTSPRRVPLGEGYLALSVAAGAAHSAVVAAKAHAA